jgi:MFS transporter, putative metabolite:H+ symporter
MQSIFTNGQVTAGAIAARLDRLPQTFTVWKMIIMLSLGFFFELYDLLFTGNIAPGLVKAAS